MCGGSFEPELQRGVRVAMAVHADHHVAEQRGVGTSGDHGAHDDHRPGGMGDDMMGRAAVPAEVAPRRRAEHDHVCAGGRGGQQRAGPARAGAAAGPGRRRAGPGWSRPRGPATARRARRRRVRARGERAASGESGGHACSSTRPAPALVASSVAQARACQPPLPPRPTRIVGRMAYSSRSASWMASSGVRRGTGGSSPDSAGTPSRTTRYGSPTPASRSRMSRRGQASSIASESGAADRPSTTAVSSRAESASPARSQDARRVVGPEQDRVRGPAVVAAARLQAGLAAHGAWSRRALPGAAPGGRPRRAGPHHRSTVDGRSNGAPRPGRRDRPPRWRRRRPSRPRASASGRGGRRAGRHPRPPPPRVAGPAPRVAPAARRTPAGPCAVPGWHRRARPRAPSARGCR